MPLMMLKSTFDSVFVLLRQIEGGDPKNKNKILTPQAFTDRLKILTLKKWSTFDENVDFKANFCHFLTIFVKIKYEIAFKKLF